MNMTRQNTTDDSIDSMTAPSGSHRSISAEQLAELGVARIAYVKPVEVDGAAGLRHPRREWRADGANYRARCGDRADPATQWFPPWCIRSALVRSGSAPGSPLRGRHDASLRAASHLTPRPLAVMPRIRHGPLQSWPPTVMAPYSHGPLQSWPRPVRRTHGPAMTRAAPRRRHPVGLSPALASFASTMRFACWQLDWICFHQSICGFMSIPRPRR